MTTLAEYTDAEVREITSNIYLHTTRLLTIGLIIIAVFLYLPVFMVPDIWTHLASTWFASIIFSLGFINSFKICFTIVSDHWNIPYPDRTLFHFWIYFGIMCLGMSMLFMNINTVRQSLPFFVLFGITVNIFGLIKIVNTEKKIPRLSISLAIIIYTMILLCIIFNRVIWILRIIFYISLWSLYVFKSIEDSLNEDRILKPEVAYTATIYPFVRPIEAIASFF